MKKILLVDDNKQDRLYLRTVLEEYAHDTRKKILISEAENGTEGVMSCTHEHYDLIFMNIIMPEMDGIEATRLIRLNDSKVMIIAISSVKDSAIKKEILHSGAEDYISKSIDLDILNARLNNYFTLIKLRKHHLSIHEGHNLYGHETYARTISFFIKDIDVLAEFWEYYLLDTHEECAILNDAIRVLYDIGMLGLKIQLKPHIWVEESDKNLYFTMEGLSELNPDFIRLIVNKNPDVTNIKIERNKLTILCPTSRNLPVVLPIETVKPTVQPTLPLVTEITPIEIPSIQPVKTCVYNYMDNEDLEDIKEHLARLNSLLLIVGSGDITPTEVDEIGYYLDRIGKSASIYSESYEIARSLGILSSTIKNNIQIFMDKSSSLGLFCKTFGLDLMNWIQLIFHDGASSVDFMDDTIISNAQMLGSMLTLNESADETVDMNAMDDIFDF